MTKEERKEKERQSILNSKVSPSIAKKNAETSKVVGEFLDRRLKEYKEINNI